MKQRFVFVINCIIFPLGWVSLAIMIVVCTAIAAPGVIIWIITDKNPGMMLIEKILSSEQLRKIGKNSIWKDCF